MVLLIGAVVRHFFNAKHTGSKGFALVWQWPLSILLAVVLIFILSPERIDENLPVSNARALSIIEKHCVSCHADKPSDHAFKSAPAGLTLEGLSQLRAHGARVITQAVATQSMPLGNRTNMTPQERAELGAWISQNQ